MSILVGVLLRVHMEQAWNNAHGDNAHACSVSLPNQGNQDGALTIKGMVWREYVSLKRCLCGFCLRGAQMILGPSACCYVDICIARSTEMASVGRFTCRHNI